MEEFNMGSLSRHRAKHRFKEALDQRLPDNPSPSETHSVYRESINELLDIAIDVEELDATTRRLAADPDAIDFPS
ncbi:hypothetical protein C450_20421 [Halococcus salifodinae DSM 8989]|uniref:Uncharacterized protein n=2 Tax=Halococcaceae TaxID=1963270 RepID=M0MRV4_9EURY|nr:hypothetical protein C450_20421 [Halococcus salifodinae DSM 8989]